MALRLYRKPFIILLFLVLQAEALFSQVILIPEAQGGGMIVKQQIWSVMINNMTGSSMQAVLHISVNDLLNAQPLLQSTSNVFLLNAGAKRVTYNDLGPMNYSFITAGFSADRQMNQPLPVGEYMVCYELVKTEANAKQITLASECIKVVAEPLSPPQLIEPANESVISDPRPLLTWTPPAPVHMFTSLSYSIIVSPLYENQSAQEALQRNIPVLTFSSTNNSVAYPASYTNLEAGKKYVWQVAAQDGNRFGGKSETWVFTVMPDSVKKIISLAPYIGLDKKNNETTVMHQGVLKMEYYNSSSDSIVQINVYRISERTNKRRQTFSFSLPVKQGQNLLEYDINKKMHLDESAVYEVMLTNNRKEKWMMKFNPKYYF